MSDRNSLHARLKLHPPKLFYPPDQHPSLPPDTTDTAPLLLPVPGTLWWRQYLCRSPLTRTHSLSLPLSLSFLYIYLRPETHRIVVFVVIIIVIPKLYVPRVYVYNNTTTTTREEPKNKLNLFDFLSFEPFFVFDVRLVNSTYNYDTSVHAHIIFLNSKLSYFYNYYFIFQ